MTWHKIYSGRPVSVSGFIPGFSVFVKSPVSVPVSAPEMHRKHRKSLPNGRQQGGAFGATPRARRFACASRRPLGVLVVFHLVRISYVFASFPEPVLARFLSKFADSESLVSQGACLKGLVAGSYRGWRGHCTGLRKLKMLSLIHI